MKQALGPGHWALVRAARGARPAICSPALCFASLMCRTRDYRERRLRKSSLPREKRSYAHLHVTVTVLPEPSARSPAPLARARS
jgi:hypothetical protein